MTKRCHGSYLDMKDVSTYSRQWFAGRIKKTSIDPCTGMITEDTFPRCKNPKLHQQIIASSTIAAIIVLMFHRTLR